MSEPGGPAPDPRGAKDAARGRRSTAAVVGAALLLTGLNALKPLAVDDTAYYFYAAHIAENPLDPYGFEIFWGEQPKPAFEVLAAPLLLYWLAGAIELFGERPLLWKLSLFPFALLLAGSLRSLLVRFARGLEDPLLWLLMLSPAVLPMFNVMQDVPALALGLASLALFIFACEEDRSWHALAAGLLVGLAVQTKYNAITSAAALLGYGLLFGRLHLALLASAAAAAVVVGWELLMALQYGSSHFLHARAVRSANVTLHGAAFQSLGFMSILGGLAVAVAPLGLFGLSARRAPVAGAIVLGSLGLVAIAFLRPEALPELHMSPQLYGGPPEQLIFNALGAGVVGVALLVLGRLLAGTGGVGEGGDDLPGRRRADLFLVGWTLLELAGCYAMWTFLASRRLATLASLLLLACGRVAATRRPHGGDLRMLRGIVGWGIAVGLLFYAADLGDALARRDAVRRAAEEIAARGGDVERDRVWFAGHWGFQYYAAQLGMQPVLAGRTRFAEGDWLVLPDGLSRQHFWVPPSRVTREASLESRSPWPWSSIPSLYAGPIPLRRQPEAQLAIRIYRVEQDFEIAEPQQRLRRAPREPARRPTAQGRIRPR